MPHATRRQLLSLTLAAGLAPAFVRHARAQDVPRFALGVASGQPRPRSLVLWTMLTGPGLPERVGVQWEMAHDAAFTQIAARGSEDAEVRWCHSVHADVSGLEPAREYWYRFNALGQRSLPARTRTAPAPDAAATLKFAIASCQRYDVGHFAAWRHLAAEAPDLIIFLGDYIYEGASAQAPLRAHQGGHARTLAQYRQRYAQYKSDPALQAAHAAAPWLLVWDDHEVDNDYAGLTAQDFYETFEAQRAAAYQAYWEHMPFPKSARPRGAHMRVYDRFEWGRLACIHAVDDRQYRDEQACPRQGRAGSNTVFLNECPDLLLPARSLLGPEQERWLAEGWDMQRPWNLLAQQTLMARFSWSNPTGGAGRYWTDGWDGYPLARQRLLGEVAQRKLRNLVVLSGDVHTHYVADLKVDYDDAKAPVLASEFCGTSISSLSLPQGRIDAARVHNPHLHYARGDQRGYVMFELDEQRLRARLTALDDPRFEQTNIRTAARFVVERDRPGPQAA